MEWINNRSSAEPFKFLHSQISTNHQNRPKCHRFLRCHPHCTDLVIVDFELVALIEPLGAATVQNLLPKPDEADEGAQCTGDNETSLETVRQQVVPVTHIDNVMSHVSTRAPPTSK